MYTITAARPMIRPLGERPKAVHPVFNVENADSTTAISHRFPHGLADHCGLIPVLKAITPHSVKNRCIFREFPVKLKSITIIAVRTPGTWFSNTRSKREPDSKQFSHQDWSPETASTSCVLPRSKRWLFPTIRSSTTPPPAPSADSCVGVQSTEPRSSNSCPGCCWR